MQLKKHCGGMKLKKTLLRILVILYKKVNGSTLHLLTTNLLLRPSVVPVIASTAHKRSPSSWNNQFVLVAASSRTVGPNGSKRANHIIACTSSGDACTPGFFPPTTINRKRKGKACQKLIDFFLRFMRFLIQSKNLIFF